MLLKETIVKWNEACIAFDAGDYAKALGLFTDVADSAKLFFGMGVCCARLGRHADAIKHFTEAIARDEHLAVGYFERGLVLQSMGNHEGCLADYDEALNRLRGNELIDYKQLGLDFKLYACEILFNRALAQLAINMRDTAVEDLQIASQLKKEARQACIDTALVDAQRTGSARSSKPFTVCSGFLFRPPADKVANAKDVDFIKGKGKVVAALDSNDNFTGFSGRKFHGAPGATPLPRQASSSTDDLHSTSSSGATLAPPAQLGRRRSMSTDSFDMKQQQQEVEKARASTGPQRPSTVAAPSAALPSRPNAPKAALPSRPSTTAAPSAAQEPPTSPHYYSTPKRTFGSSPSPAPAPAPAQSSAPAPGPHRPPPPRTAPPAHSAAPAQETPVKKWSTGTTPAQSAHSAAQAQETPVKKWSTGTTPAQSSGQGDAPWVKKSSTGSAPAHNPPPQVPQPPIPASEKVSAPTAALLAKFGGGVAHGGPAVDSRPISTVSGYSGLSGVSSASDGTMKIKCHYKDTRVVQVPVDVSFADLHAAVLKKFGATKLTLQYKDEDGDLVSMADQSDLDMAREAMQNKLLLWCTD